jgi:pimeloyl-ACP methyl ester carboxylesterase
MFTEQRIDSLRSGKPSGKLSLTVGPATGPPLLLLHGVLRKSADFFPLLAPFAPRWQTYGLDFRGHGKSDRGDAYRVVDYVDDAAAALRDIGRPTVVYGHSLGAMVALAVAARLPAQVAALVLEDPPFATMGGRIGRTSFLSLFVGIQQALREGGDVRALTQRLADIRVTNPQTNSSIRLGDVRDGASLRFSARCLTQLDPAVLTPIVAGDWLHDYDLAGMLGHVACPVLLLQSDLEAGGMLTDEDAQRLTDALADCTRVQFPQVGHLIHWQAREALLTVVGNFLESLH